MTSRIPAPLFLKWSPPLIGGLFAFLPLLLTPQVFEPFVIGKQTIAGLCALILLFLWMHDRLLGQPIPTWRTPLDIPVAFFLILCVLSTIWGWRNPGQLYRLANVGLWTVLGYLLVVAMRQGLSIQRIQLIHHFPAAIVCMIAVLQHFGWNGPLQLEIAGPDWRFAIVSTLGNPNFVSGYLDIIVPSLLVYGLYRCPKWCFWLGWLPCWGLVVATLLLTFTMGAYTSLSIAGITAIIAAACGYGLGFCSKRRVGSIVILTLSLGYWAFSDNSYNGFPQGGVLDAAKASPKWWGGMGGRYFNWNLALTMMKEHPVGGIGFGNFYALNETYGGSLRAQLGYVDASEHHPGVDQPHQLPLELAAEMGPFGAFVAWWIPISLFVLAWRQLRSHPHRRLDVLPALLGVVACTVHGLLSFPMHLPASAFATLGCAAIVVAGPPDGLPPIQTVHRHRLWVLLPIGAVLAGLGWFTLQPFRAQQTAMAGQNLSPQSIAKPHEALLYSLAAMEQAVAIYPYDESLWERLGYYRQRAGDEAGARNAWIRAIALAEHLPTHRLLKNSWLRANNLKQAIHHQRALTRLNPGHIPYWQDLIFLLNEAGLPTNEAEVRLRELERKAEIEAQRRK